jgi:glutamyl-tRNA reductase
MKFQVVGCSHHGTSIAIRERLAFSPTQAAEALDQWRRVFSGVEAVVLSTCNRVEIYAASDGDDLPACPQVAGFLGRFHGIEAGEILGHLYQSEDKEAVGHLFRVACSLDSMVLGESQILAQVKQAYHLAVEHEIGRAHV